MEYTNSKQKRGDSKKRGNKPYMIGRYFGWILIVAAAAFAVSGLFINNPQPNFLEFAAIEVTFLLTLGLTMVFQSHTQEDMAKCENQLEEITKLKNKKL
jgi:uncharacterized membrane protein